MAKTSKQIAINSDTLQVKEHKDIPDQTHAGELQVFEALRRRGVAMAFADMITWEVHERYLQMLTSHLREDPPPGYARPSLQQILKADRQVFLCLIRSGVAVRRRDDNTLALDTASIQARPGQARPGQARPGQASPAQP